MAALAVAFLAGPAAASEDSARWLERLVAALRVGNTQAAQIAAHTRDYTGSEREFQIQWLRRAEPGKLRAVVEMREAGTPTPVLVAFEARDDTLVSWSWDIRFRSFIRLSSMIGTENFAGTHFRLEDLGFTQLASRRGAEALRVESRAGPEILLRSGPIEGHYTARVDTHIDPDTALPRHVEIYDHTGARVWEQHYRRVKQVDGHSFPWEMETSNPVTQERSLLEVEWLRFDLPIRDEAFDLEELTRRMKADEDPVQLPPLQSAARPSGELPLE